MTTVRLRHGTEPLLIRWSGLLAVAREEFGIGQHTVRRMLAEGRIRRIEPKWTLPGRKRAYGYFILEDVRSAFRGLVG
jgi:hypothetical protein